MIRFVAFIVAASIGVGGVVPRWTAYRCQMMEAVTEHPCCAKQQRTEATIGGACCDAFEAPALAARIVARGPESKIAPAPFVGLLSLPSRALLSSKDSVIASIADAAPPPARGILTLSAILRV
jgi:hypothetical protein